MCPRTMSPPSARGFPARDGARGCWRFRERMATGGSTSRRMVRELTREQARRAAVRAQLLTADRPADLVQMVDQLTLLQLDPTAAIAPSADLVAWSRLGSSYKPEQLKQALEQDRTLLEVQRGRATDPRRGPLPR